MQVYPRRPVIKKSVGALVDDRKQALRTNSRPFKVHPIGDLSVANCCSTKLQAGTTTSCLIVSAAALKPPSSYHLDTKRRSLNKPHQVARLLVYKPAERGHALSGYICIEHRSHQSKDRAHIKGYKHQATQPLLPHYSSARKPAASRP